MKKTFLFIAMAAAALGFTACEDTKEPVYHEPTEFVLNTPAFANQLYMLGPNDSVAITCSQPNYGYAATPTYTVDVTLDEKFVEADEANGVEANYKTIKCGNSAVLMLPAPVLDKALLELLGIKGYSEFPAEGVKPISCYIRANAALDGVASSAITSNTIKLEALQLYNCYPQTGRTIYLIGQGTPAGWDINGTSGALQETGVGTNIYVGAYDIPAGELRFRIYETLGEWGGNGALPSIGSGPDDDTAVDIEIGDTPTQYTAVPGKGSWLLSDWEGGFVTFTLNMTDPDNMVLTLQAGNHDTNGKAFIYLVGACSAWSVTDPNAENIYADFKLFDMEDNGVYTGTFEVPAGSATFRFYTELGDWDKGSLGYQVADESTDLPMTDNSYSGPYVEGKGNWSFPDWKGGKMEMTVNTTDNTVLFKAAE